MSQYNWTLECGRPGNHRFFRDTNTGRVAVADDSGPTPDLTDDGVLWVSEIDGIRTGESLFSIKVQTGTVTLTAHEAMECAIHFGWVIFTRKGPATVTRVTL